MTAAKAGVLLTALLAYAAIGVWWGWIAVAATFVAGIAVGVAAVALGDWRDERIRRQIRRRQERRA